MSDDAPTPEDLLIGMGVDPDTLVPVSEEEAKRAMHEWNPSTGDPTPDDEKLVHGNVCIREGDVVFDTTEERGRFVDSIDGMTVTLGVCSLREHHSPSNPPMPRVGDRLTVEWPEMGGRFRLTELSVSR